MQVYKNDKFPLWMKLCLALGFCCDVGVRSVSEAGKMLAVLASHVHILPLNKQQRPWQED